MTNQNAHKGTYFEDLFCLEIVKAPQNIREIVEAFPELVPKNQEIKFVEREGQQQAFDILRHSLLGQDSPEFLYLLNRTFRLFRFIKWRNYWNF